METGQRDFTRDDYEMILSLPNHLAMVLTVDGRLIKTAEKSILGWLPGETIGHSVTDFIFEADIPVVKNILKEVLEKPGSTVADVRVRCRKKGGDYRWISWSAVSMGDKVYAMGIDATDKVETETALAIQRLEQQEYQTRFRTFFEQSNLAMEIYALNGEPLAVNKAWEDLFQTTRIELRGYNLFHDEQIKNSDLWNYLQLTLQGESVEVPAFWYDPDRTKRPGRGRWLEAWLSPVKDGEGNMREIAMILKDVTDRVETEQALVRSISERKAAEEKYQVISDRFALAARAGKIGLWEWTPGSNFVKWDETTEKIFGYMPGAFPQTAEAYNDLIHPEDRAVLWKQVEGSIQKRASYNIDHRAVTIDGRELWLHCSGMALYDDHGMPYHMMGTMIDITERKMAEEDQKFLSQASEYLLGSFDHKVILENLCNHAISYFCDGCFIDELQTDGSIRRMLVVHPGPNIRAAIMELDRLFPDRYRKEHPYLSAMETGKTLFSEDADQLWEKLRATHGEEYYQALKRINAKASINVRLKGHQKTLGMITFFTLNGSKKRLERRHIWLAEELAYRASMAFENVMIHQGSIEAIRSRDEFLSIASHELKTPLQSLTLQNQMRKRNLDKNLVDSFSPNKIGNMIEADLRHLSRIKRLIDDMLDISSIRAGKLTFQKESFAVCAFVKDVIDRFRPQLDASGCSVSTSYGPEVQILADMYRMEQVLVNLLTNAVKYGSGRPIEVAVETRQRTVRISVKDNGPGIRKEDLERIFERFERAISSNEVSGLGLGLYISRQIIHQHEGQIYVESAKGEGSIFTIEFPLP